MPLFANQHGEDASTAHAATESPVIDPTGNHSFVREGLNMEHLKHCSPTVSNLGDAMGNLAACNMVTCDINEISQCSFRRD